MEQRVAEADLKIVRLTLGRWNNRHLRHPSSSSSSSRLGVAAAPPVPFSPTGTRGTTDARSFPGELSRKGKRKPEGGLGPSRVGARWRDLRGARRALVAE